MKDEQYAYVDGEHCSIKGYVLVDADYIQLQMDTLRKMIGIIAMTSIEGDEEFKDVYQQIFPIEGQTMKRFNVEDDE